MDLPIPWSMVSVGCMPRLGDLLVNHWEEWRSSLSRGLMAPRQEPFIQAAAGQFLWGRPFQTQLLHSVRQDAEKIGVHAWAWFAGLRRLWGGGVVVWARQLLGIWSRQWQAVVQFAVIASTEWDQIARSCRGMLVWTGEENGWKLSVGREWGTGGTAGVSSLISGHWDPLPRCFLLAGPWEEKSGKTRGAGLYSENKTSREHRKERLMSPQWWHSVPLSAVSACVMPKHETHSPC